MRKIFHPAFILLMLFSLIFSSAGCRSDGEKKERKEDFLSAEELYQDAKTSLNARNYDGAIRGYKLLRTRYPFGRHTEQAQLELAYAYFRDYEPERALSAASRFIKTYPTHPNVDYAYYLKGLVNYDQNIGFLNRMMPERIRDRDTSGARQSFNDFSELIRKFPDSRYAPEAKQRMIFLRNNLSAYEIEVAKYYMRRKAFVAAANRARYVIETYPNTPENAKALSILHAAYTELEMPQLAEDAIRVLELNYPDHPYITGHKQKRGLLSRLWPFD